MPPGPFELATTISNLGDLRASDLRPYDAVYLGNLYCPRYEGNLLERPTELRDAVRLVQDQGCRAYVTTYAAPHGRDIDRLRRALEAARAAGALAAEVHGPGLARLVREEFPELLLHLGSFANVYTSAGAAVHRRLGAVRIAPPAELPLDEIAELRRRRDVPVEVTVHGKVPLGVSDSCLLLGCETALGVECPALCRQDVFLSRGDWVLKSVGTGVLSGRDSCLLEHLPRLAATGTSASRPCPRRPRTGARWVRSTGMPSTARSRAPRGSSPNGGHFSGRTRARGSVTGLRSAGAASSTSGPAGPAPTWPTWPR
jgi:U32 family peptidase